MITIDNSKCILCRACSSSCPVNAIEVGDEQMKTYPGKCIDCGTCVRACPLNIITLHKGVKK